MSTKLPISQEGLAQSTKSHLASSHKRPQCTASCLMTSASVMSLLGRFEPIRSDAIAWSTSRRLGGLVNTIQQCAVSAQDQHQPLSARERQNQFKQWLSKLIFA